MIVHVLHHGLALCGLPSPPASWPEGHRWVAWGGPELGAVTCGVCRAALPSEGPASVDRERWLRAQTLLEAAENMVTWAACHGDDPAIAEIAHLIRQAQVRLQARLNPLTIEQLLELPKDR